VSVVQHICDECFGKFVRAKPTRTSNKDLKNIGHIYSPFVYGTQITRAVLKLKYGNEGLVAKVFAPFMVESLGRDANKFDVIIPVPLSKKRERERGFNQATLLAKELSEVIREKHKIDLPVCDKILVRIKNTAPQVNMSHEARIANQKDSYKICDKFDISQIKQKRILIVDDVMTSGATANECAKVLKDAGVKSVSVVVIAKVGD